MIKYKEELESLPHYYRSKFSIDCSREETEDEKSTEMLEASQVEEVIKKCLLRQIDEDNKRFLEYVGEDEECIGYGDLEKPEMSIEIPKARNELRAELRDKVNKNDK